MDELEIAFFTIVPLAIVSVIVVLYYILKQRRANEDSAIEKLEIAEKENASSKAAFDDKEVKEQSRLGKSKFRSSEYIKGKERNSLFKAFDSLDNPKKKAFNFKTKHYHIRHLQKITDKQTDIKDNLSKIKAIHKDSPLSKLRKISKKPNSKYLALLIKKEEKPKEKKQAIDPIKKLASLPDKRTKILNQLKQIHH